MFPIHNKYQGESILNIKCFMNLFKKRYFKGWYFKCCSDDKTVAFIPAYHCCNGKKTASLQVITDDTAVNIPFGELKYNEKKLYIKLGKCIFSGKGILLNYKDEESDIVLKGSVRFKSLSPIRYDIMGPFSAVPFMQCRHSVYSMAHRIDGQLTLNGVRYDFNGGAGYIEGDRGYSFPKQYIWTQCSFEGGSLMLSVADIPILGFHFTGIIGIVMIDGKEHRIATYLGARVSRLGRNYVTIKQGSYRLTARLIKKNSHALSAPVNGSMCRTIHESASCTAYYRFSYKGNVLCEFESDRAAFEFEY